MPTYCSSKRTNLPGEHTAAGASKLMSDLTSLDVSQAELGKLLGQALTGATLGGTAATTLGVPIASLFYPKIAAELTAGRGGYG